MKKVALPLLFVTGITVADSRTGYSGKDALSVSQPIAQHVERMPQHYEFWKWQKKKEKEDALKFLMPETTTLTGSSKTLTAEQQKLLEKVSSNLVFIENKGQWPREILFLCQNNGTDIWISDVMEIAMEACKKGISLESLGFEPKLMYLIMKN